MADDKIIIEIEIGDKKAIKSIKKFKQGKAKQAASDAGDTLGKEIGQGIRRQLTGLGAVLVATLGVKKIINLNREFGKSLAEINTIATALTQTQKELSNQLISTSVAYGTSAQEQARSFYQIISAGIIDTKTANEVLIQSNKLAIGGLTTAEGAVDLLTSTINAFGKENLSAERAADILFGTVRLGKTRIEDLQSSMGLILPSAKALRVSFEDVAGAVAQLTTKGISTSEAVTQVNAVFTALLRKQEAARKLGTEVAEAFNLQALRAKGLTKFLLDLNVATGGSEIKLQKLLGRTEGVKAILSLASDGFVGLADKIKQLENSTGAADQAFLIMQGTLDFKMRQAASTFDAIILQLSGDTTILAATIDLVVGEMNDLLKAFQIFGSARDVFGAIITSYVIDFKNLQLSIMEVTRSIPLIGIFLKKLDEVNPASSIAGVRLEVEALEQSILNMGDFTVPASDSLDGFVDKLKTAMSSAKNTTIKATKDISNAINSNLVKGVSQGLQAVGAALTKGAGGFDNFGKVVLGILGDFAIQVGTLLISMGLAIDQIKTSLATFNGASLVAAGAALVVIGGALKALGGGATAAPVGGGGVTAPGAGGGGAVIEPISEDDIEAAGPKTEVTLIVQGNILDRRETGLELAEVLRETFQTNDIQFA